MQGIYIGIDLAWGEKNPSGICVLTPKADKLQILDIKLIYSIKDILSEINAYADSKVYVGIDAPLVIPNESGNREIEKEFNKDFSKYKISMLPVNRTLLKKYSPKLRSQELFQQLLACGFQRDYTNDKVVYEVYTHSTIAVCFNEYKILPYKRKKGRNTAFIKEQLQIYTKYLQSVTFPHAILATKIEDLKGSKLKAHEDMLDALSCGFCLYYCKNHKHKFYSVEGVATFLTPI